jgi:hypothetical protein
MRTSQRICSVLLVASSIAATGCASHDRRDSAWDPQGHRALIDQLPNWDRKAMMVCGGHLPPEQRRPHQTGRC